MKLFGLFQSEKSCPPCECKLDGSPPEPAVLKDGVTTLQGFCEEVQRLCPAAFKGNLPGMAALSLYAYGGVMVLSEQKGYAPLQTQIIYRELLRRFFGFTGPFEEAGAAREDSCRKEASEPSSNFYPIIQRGSQEFRKWQAQRETFEAADFRTLMSAPPWGPL